MRILVLVLLVACSDHAVALKDSRGNWSQSRLLCDGVCCSSLDRACFTAVCAAKMCKAPMPKTPLVVAPARVRRVVAGGSVTCVITEGNTVRCWGAIEQCSAPYGYAAVEDLHEAQEKFPMPRTYPSDVPLGMPVDDVAVGSEPCALMRDRSVRCWGSHDGKIVTRVQRATAVTTGASFIVPVRLFDDQYVVSDGIIVDLKSRKHTTEVPTVKRMAIDARGDLLVESTDTIFWASKDLYNVRPVEMQLHSIGITKNMLVFQSEDRDALFVFDMPTRTWRELAFDACVPTK